MNTASNPTEQTITSYQCYSYQCYSYAEVFEKIQPLLKDGLKFDLETNVGFPQQIGTVFTFTVIEAEPQSMAPSDTYLDAFDDVTEDEAEQLLQAIEQIPGVKISKTRRAKLEG